jgi:hypothetical protein
MLLLWNFIIITTITTIIGLEHHHWSITIETSPFKHHHWHPLGLQGPLTQELRTRELGPGRCLLGLCHGRWRRSAGLWFLNTSTDGATAVINSTVVQNPQRVQAIASARNDVFPVCCKRSSCSSWFWPVLAVEPCPWDSQGQTSLALRLEPCP